MQIVSRLRWREIEDWFSYANEDPSWPKDIPPPDYQRLRCIVGGIGDNMQVEREPEFTSPPQSPELLYVSEILGMEVEELQTTVERLRQMSKLLGGTAYTVRECRDIARECKRRWEIKERRKYLERRHAIEMLRTTPQPVSEIPADAVVREVPFEFTEALQTERKRLLDEMSRA
jgi:hypothetical protein